MPIFISYSQQDMKFVDRLAMQLVAARHNVWMDRWELSVGDSLTQKIETALTGASAILVIVSKHSIQSDWFKRELSAGLIRELEERKTLVMPCVIDDCKIPLFLKDKLYADFRKDPDAAFQMVNRSLARISNPTQDRIEDLKFHTDWSVTWDKDEDGRRTLNWTFIDHGHEWPYVILTECLVVCDEIASRSFGAALSAGRRDEHIVSVMARVLSGIGKDQINERLSDASAKVVAWKVKSEGLSGSLAVVMTCRRLGVDNGMDTLVHLDAKLRMAHDQMKTKLFKPS